MRFTPVPAERENFCSTCQGQDRPPFLCSSRSRSHLSQPHPSPVPPATLPPILHRYMAHHLCALGRAGGFALTRLASFGF